MKIILRTLLFGLLFVSSTTDAKEIKINSLKELAKYASESGNIITMKPGVYKLTDYLNSDSISIRKNRKMYQYITFSGSNNIFNLKGVEIELDTEIRTKLKPPIHSD